MKHSTHVNMSVTSCLRLPATLVIGTIAPPSIAKEDDSHWGKSRFSGRRSDISINLLPKICVTTFAGIGGRPGPSINDEVRPT